MPIFQQVAETAGAATVAGALAAGGYAYAALWPPSKLFGHALIAPRNPVAGPAELALTFDDGPNPDWTPRLLDVLAEHQVRATFFLLGKYAAIQPDLVRRIHAGGNLIGNHSWDHPNLALTSLRRTQEELRRTTAELEQIIGAPVRYFRPPFGGRRPGTFRVARELGLVPVLWNALTSDWSATDPARVTSQLSSLIARAQSRGYAANVVLHDGGQESLRVDRAASVAAASQLMQRFKATHRFVTLDVWPEA